MSMLGYDYFYSLSDEERQETFIVLIIFIVVCIIIYFILRWIKKKYNDKIQNCKNKLIKKFFDEL